MNISEQILQAVDILTDVKLSKLKYDKTVQGRIYDIIDLNKGIYKVRYQGNVFTAYARDVGKSYEIDESVFIKIPEGDFSNQKIITGRVTEQSLSAAQLNNLATTIVESSPDISTFLPEGALSSQPWKVAAGAAAGDANYIDKIYGDLDSSYSLNNLLAQYASQYEHLYISANFRTPFNATHTKGNYGIEICFFTGSEPGQEITYKLDIGSFNGDPYGLRTYSPQSAIFAVEKGILKGIKYIRLFQEGFAWDYYSDGKAAQKITEPNIFAKDLEIKFVEVKDLSDELYYCYIAAPYGQTLNTDIQNISLQARLLSRGKQVREDKCTFKWFERDLSVFPGGEKYDSAAGYGWTPLEGMTTSAIELAYPQISQYHKRSFKVVVSYDDVVMSSEKDVLNGNSQYDYTIRQITSGDTIKLQLENNKNNDILKGDWYLSYPDGTFAEVTDGKMQNSIAVGDALRFGSVVFYCAIYDYAYNFIVGTLSYNMTKSQSEDDIIVTYSGQDTFNYNANGDPAADSYDEGHELSAQIRWREGKGASDYKVKWISPDGNPITDELTAVVSNSMLRNLWVDSDQKLHYNVSNKFDYRANNNTLSVMIEFDTGERFTFAKEILFLKDGDQGTNGTSYIALVRPCNDLGQKENRYRALKYRNGAWDNTEDLQLKCFVYKDGELLNGNADYNLTFDWTGSVHVECLTPTAEKTIVRGPIGEEITDQSTSKDLERYVRVEVTLKDLDDNRNLKIYVFYPIDVIVGDLDEDLIDLSYLPNSIKYSSAGERPEFINQARIQVGYNGNDYSEGLESITPALVEPVYDTSKQIYKLNIAEYYNSESKKDQSSIGILKCNINSDYILHPIVMYLDTFGTAEINGWDGKYLEIGEENGKKTYILAPQVGAGKKDPVTNTFTGVVMGKKNMENADSGEDYAFAARTGLFGYQDGNETFGFLDTGLAFIGKAGSGRIWFDGSHGEIYSGNYKENVSGMKIDLDNGHIDSYNFKLTSGNMLLNSADQKFEFTVGSVDNSRFLITHKDGSNLFYVADDAYYLQSRDYVASTTGVGSGMRINLDDGKIDAYNFRLRSSCLNINSETNKFQFDVAANNQKGSFTIKAGNISLMNVSENSYYLRSVNYNEQSGINLQGVYINLQTGRFQVGGNAEFNGTIRANDGNIGGWYINAYGLRNSDNTIYLQSNGDAKFGNNFYIANGSIFASGGTIGGWTIGYDFQGIPCLSSGQTTLSSAYGIITNAVTISGTIIGQPINGTIGAMVGYQNGAQTACVGIQSNNNVIIQGPFIRLQGNTTMAGGTLFQGTVDFSQLAAWQIIWPANYAPW